MPLGKPIDSPRHYLRIVKARRGYDWSCTCGEAHGHQETEAACEFSHNRHLISVRYGYKRQRKRF